MKTQLEPLEPREAVQMYLQAKKTDGASENTVKTHRSRLGFFAGWCEQEGITNLNDLSGRDCNRYKLFRADDVSKVTLKSQVDTLRVFLRYCSSIDAVEPELPDKVQSPTLGKGEDSRDVMVAPEAAEAIEEYLRKYRYAGLWHTFCVLLRTGLRVGSIRSLDVEDYEREEGALSLSHRPTSDTPLKNKEAGERYVSLSESTMTVLGDWLADQRYDITDDYGRKPLLTTRYGRPNDQSLRKISYAITRPCWRGAECPHDRTPETCDAADNSSSKPHECPSSKSPHPWRRLSITMMLRNEAPAELVGDRCNVSTKVIDQHYDERTKREKMEARREWFDDLL